MSAATVLRRLVAVLSAATLPACSESEPAVPSPGDSTGTPRDSTPTQLTLTAREVVSGLASPVFLTTPANDPRLFVLEQGGRIRIVRDGRLESTPFLDLTGRLSSSGERGLLGLAFHPRYAQNGQFYVNYTDPSGDTRIERYRVSTSDPNRADPASAQLVLTVAQPYANHNGGMIAFGPDGMLYIGMGDGGSGGDPQRHGQNMNSLLGKMLRLDVDNVTGSAAYSVPRDNPFVGRAGARGEIWALGLRNPWRFSFDAPGARLYIADVGQNRLEEIDVAGVTEAGLNYGWNRMEANECYDSATCDRSGLKLPIEQYGRDVGCSVTGGYVYRGALTGLRGHYFYSDYCTGFLRSFRLGTDGAIAERRTWSVGSLGNVTSFGVDAAGELYILSANGRVYKLAAQ